MERQRQPVEPVYYTNQSAGQEMTPKVDGFQSFQVQPQHHRFSEFSTATFNSNKPQFASFDPAKSPPEIPTTGNWLQYANTYIIIPLESRSRPD